jgi:hypothetical protein
MHHSQQNKRQYELLTFSHSAFFNPDHKCIHKRLEALAYLLLYRSSQVISYFRSIAQIPVFQLVSLVKLEEVRSSVVVWFEHFNSPDNLCNTSIQIHQSYCCISGHMVCWRQHTRRDLGRWCCQGQGRIQGHRNIGQQKSLLKKI